MNRRRFVAGAATLALGACARTLRRVPFDAIVTRVPGSGGIPHYTTIAAAIAAAPADGKRPWCIRVTRGYWREKLVVDRPNVHLVGDGRHACTIGYDAAAGQRRPDGEPWGTWGCASVIVRAPGFHGSDMTIENAFYYLRHLRAPTLEQIGPNGAQAVALMLDAGSDRARLDRVDVVGHQDTLFVDAGRSRFVDCRVSGSVDFVFGGGTCLLERCEIVSRFRPGKERQGYVAVPSTPAAQAHGLVFRQCRLLCEPQVPRASVALGRPWRPTRTFPDGRYGDPAVRGSAVFVDCWMDAHIDPAGWDAMAYTARDGSRVMFAPGEARLAEIGSRGPGAARGGRRVWLGDEEVAGFSTRVVLSGWDGG